MRHGNLIRERRRASGKTQAQLAHDSGWRQNDISRLEKQHRNQTIEAWIRLARALNTTVEDLYGDFVCENI